MFIWENYTSPQDIDIILPYNAYIYGNYACLYNATTSQCFRYNTNTIIDDFILQKYPDIHLYYRDEFPYTEVLILGGLVILSWITWKQMSTFIKHKDNPWKLYKICELCEMPPIQVAGLYVIRKQLDDYITFMVDRDEFVKKNLRLPRGLLFAGPPGNGKTLISKYMAQKAQVNFISCMGSDFNEMFVGVGVSRMRSMFKCARENQPCIIFIDEIDSIGGQRQQNINNNEGTNLLNKLLSEMDGFQDKTHENIMVIAATNRVKSLDDALLRSGRFDEKLYFDPPNIQERREIIDMYVEKYNIELNHTIGLPQRCAGASCADIEMICNYYGILLHRNSKACDLHDDSHDDSKACNSHDDPHDDSHDDSKACNSHDDSHDGKIPLLMDKAIDHIMVGSEKKERVLSKDERIRVAYHEAGHAVIASILEEAPLKVSLIPRGQAALGFSQQMPNDQKLFTCDEMFNRVKILMGGQVSEFVFLKNISTGASDDIEKATHILRQAVTRWGFVDEIGFVMVDESSQQQLAIADTAISNLSHQLYKETQTIINTYKSKVEKLALLLLEKEELDRDDIMEIINTP